jgi:hypothetical protein
VKRFLFTSDPPNEEGEGQMPAGGLIAHLTEKCGGNVHEKGAVQITASSSSNNTRIVCRGALFMPHLTSF